MDPRQGPSLGFRECLQAELRGIPGPQPTIFDVLPYRPFRVMEVGLKWPLGCELGDELNGVCQGTGEDD